MKYNEDYGPETDTINDESRQAQQALFQELQYHYVVSPSLTAGCDYFKVASIDGIDYYHPNNEDWGQIIAIDWDAELAVNTTFYEMDDMAAPGSDYAFTNHEDRLVPKFTTTNW